MEVESILIKSEIEIEGEEIERDVLLIDYQDGQADGLDNRIQVRDC